MNPEALLTLKRAAELAGVTDRALRARAARGTLATVEHIIDGRAQLAVTVAELRRAYPERAAEHAKERSAVLIPRARPSDSAGGRASAASTPALEAELAAAREHAAILGRLAAERETTIDVERARCGAAEREAAELRERATRAELERERFAGELAAATRAESWAQRAADRIEERAEARIGRVQAQLDVARREALTLSRALGQAEASTAKQLGKAGGPPERLSRWTSIMHRSLYGFAVFFAVWGIYLICSASSRVSVEGGVFAYSTGIAAVSFAVGLAGLVLALRAR